MGSFLEKIKKKLSAGRSNSLDGGKTMTGMDPNEVIVNPDVIMTREDKIPSFMNFFTEARGGGYDDEHATVHLWNSIVNHRSAKKILNHPNAGLIQQEIEKAKTDPKHPLNVANAPQDGFTKGVVNPEAYYNELHHAAGTIHALANHPSLQAAAQGKGVARVTGAARGQLSDVWKKHGAKNATSKADIEIEHGDNTHTISLKKGDAQLMSAQPEEFGATYDHATNEHMKVNKAFTTAHKKKIMSRIEKVKANLAAMAGADPKEQGRLRDEAQKHINAIHQEHPGLINHVTYEASTGHGKFGQGGVGTARYLVTSLPDGAHIHDTVINHEPIIAGTPRVALPKGSGRPGNVKLDYKAVRSKPAAMTATAPVKRGRGKAVTEAVDMHRRHHVLFWGRANPPHAGHEQAYNLVKSLAKKYGGTGSIVLSRTYDAKKNPLTPEQKEKHARRAFPDVPTSVADPQHPTLLHQLSKLHENGVTDLHMIAGQDRIPEYDQLINKYNGVKGNHGYFNFKNIKIHSSGDRDPDAEGVEGVSASSQRAHAAAGRANEFADAAPSTMKPQHVTELYNDVRAGLAAKGKK